MSSAQELKKVGSVSLVNPLVLETLEKLIDKKKNTAKVAFNSDLQKIYSTVTQKSFTAAETLIKKPHRFWSLNKADLRYLFSYCGKEVG